MVTVRMDEIFKDIVETMRDPLLVLDSDFKVISANRSFYGVFKVKPEETVGQVIYDLGNKQWDILKLRELMATILNEKTSFDNYEVEHDFAIIGKRTMLLNARQIERAMGEEQILLLAIEDITVRKKIEAGLEKNRKEFAILKNTADEAREYAENIIKTVREPLIVLDQNLRVVTASHSFYGLFKTKPKVTEGRLIYDLGHGQWNIPKLKELFEEILPGNTVFNDFEVDHSFDGIGPKIMHLNARKIYKGSKKNELILLAIEDVTEKEYHKRNLEKMVEERTAQLFLEKQKAEQKKLLAEKSLQEIESLKKQLEDERAYLKAEIKLENNHENIIGQSDGLKYVLHKIKQIAESNTTVLVLGETGTGKELVARAIHGFSSRKSRALIKVNCAALPSNLIESELFGHEKGAFTSADRTHVGRFEIADKTTLFLDEIGELPLDLQSKLLRVLQDGEFERLGNSRTIKVDVRIVAATNRNLEEEVEKGRFRSDLWYRLNIFPITMPPLRERKEDIPLLLDFYIEKISRRLGKQIEVIPKNVMNAMLNYHWPGNVREFENVLERAVINSSGSKLHLADDLEKFYRHPSKDLKTMEAVERDHIIRVLEQTHWKVSGKNSASQILGLNRGTLRARMRNLDIVVPERLPFDSK